MLQYAIGRHLSIKYKSPLWLDLSWFEKQNKIRFKREFRLDSFNIKYGLVNLKNMIWRLRYTDRFKAINPLKLKNVKEKDYASFDAAVLEAGDNILLEGFFSSYRYFEAIRDVLVKDFAVVEKMDTANITCLQKIKNTNSVGIHIRRGDYALTDFHGILDTTYYEAAIKLIAQKTGDLHLFVFSDEPGWVSQHMKFDHPFELVNFNHDEHDYFDMELMKHCRHNIIANSSFSWWPAWLNEYPEKIIVAPGKWFNQGNNNYDMIPQNWVSLASNGI